MKNIVCLVLSTALIISACNTGNKKSAQLSGTTEMDLPEKEAFNTSLEGKPVVLYEVKNENGILIQFTNYGARVVSVVAPDKHGQFDDIALGYNTLREYQNDGMSTGCIVGRYANRIAGGEFTLEGKTYHLFKNNGPNTLHGGKEGFQQKVWDVLETTDSTIAMQYVSPHMQENFPGELTLTVTYTLSDKNELVIDYEATTDRTTVVNFTNHSYFNLKGEGNQSILDHQLRINADYITPVDSTLIPTGEFMPVENTPFDFNTLTRIGKRIDNNHQQLEYGNGYDHNWVLDKEPGELSPAALLYEPQTGRTLEIHTTEPGIQVYTGNFMDGSATGKSGKPYVRRSGVALETQHFPDSPNQPDFPSTRLEPGKTYTQKTIYKFGVRE